MINGLTITILGIIDRPVFYLKHGGSQTGFCLRLQAEPTQLGLINRASLCLRAPATAPETETCFINLAQFSGFHLKTKTESSLRNVMF
jgi:hypothetical protein